MASRARRGEDSACPLCLDVGGGDRAKRSFLAAMSHELRTPLNAIIGFAEIMDGQLFGRVSPEPYPTYVHDILLSARFVLQIIEDVLEISRAEAGELVLNKREVHVDALVDAAVAEVSRALSDRDCRFNADISPDLVAQVDPDKIRRLLALLLSNAIKFSPAGGDVQIKGWLTSRGELRVEIADRGIGMSAKGMALAFEPFVQIDDRLSRAFEGAGLGLPLARILAELHDGSVELQSKPGEGSKATLVLPAYYRQSAVG